MTATNDTDLARPIPFFENLSRIVTEQKRDLYHVLACAGCQPTTTFKAAYETGEEPKLRELIALADILQCSVDELLGRTTVAKTS